MSRSLPTRLKVTHSTVTSILEGLRVSSLCTSMVLVRRGCTSTVALSPSHLTTEEHQDEHRRVKTALERSCSIAIQLENLQSINQMYFIQPFSFYISSVYTYVFCIPGHWYQRIVGAGYPEAVQVRVVTFFSLTMALGFSTQSERTNGIITLFKSASHSQIGSQLRSIFSCQFEC